MKWINLNTTDLPEDYFEDNDYIFQWRREGVNDNQWSVHKPFIDNTRMALKGKLSIITNLVETNCEYQYYMPEVKKLQRKEIFCRWWKTDRGQWVKVISYFVGGDFPEAGPYLLSAGGWQKRVWFLGRESSDIPPEAE